MVSLLKHPKVQELLRWSFSKEKIGSPSGNESPFSTTIATYREHDSAAVEGCRASDSFVIGTSKSQHHCIPPMEVVKAVDRLAQKTGHTPSDVTLRTRYVGHGLAGFQLGYVCPTGVRGINPNVGDLAHEIGIGVCYDSAHSLSVSDTVTRLACLNGMTSTVAGESVRKRSTAQHFEATKCNVTGKLIYDWSKFHKLVDDLVSGEDARHRSITAAIKFDDECKVRLGYNPSLAAASYCLTGNWMGSRTWGLTRTEDRLMKTDPTTRGKDLQSSITARKRVREISEARYDWGQEFQYPEQEGEGTLFGVRNLVTWTLDNPGAFHASRFDPTTQSGAAAREAVYNRLDCLSEILPHREEAGLNSVMFPEIEELPALEQVAGQVVI